MYNKLINLKLSIRYKNMKISAVLQIKMMMRFVFFFLTFRMLPSFEDWLFVIFKTKCQRAACPFFFLLVKTNIFKKFGIFNWLNKFTTIYLYGNKNEYKVKFKTMLSCLRLSISIASRGRWHSWKSKRKAFNAVMNQKTFVLSWT